MFRCNLCAQDKWQVSKRVSAITTRAMQYLGTVVAVINPVIVQRNFNEQQQRPLRHKNGKVNEIHGYFTSCAAVAGTFLIAKKCRLGRTMMMIIICESPFQGGRVCYTAHPRNGEGVISLKSAGDISVPQHHQNHQGPTRRGLIVPQQPPNPPTIIPLTHAR